MKEITVSAKTYDEALTKALIDLQTTSDNVTINIVEEGTEGLFGLLGGKPWVIDVKIKSADDTKEAVKEEIKKAVEEKVEEVKEVKEEIKKVAEEKIAQANADEADDDTFAEAEEEIHAAVITPITLEDANELIEKAEKFLADVFEKMGMTVNLETSFNFDENEMSIVLSGDDMGVLIGKRGQTLDSLQYLVSLVVNKGNDNYIRVKVDTENYRERRKETLENLAKNMAFKVKRTRRPLSLEPMNPYERRIIHSALQGDKFVTTHSEGEEPYRHVVVTLKK